MKKFKKLAAFTASLMIAAASIVSTTGITGFAATNLTINKPGATAPDTENTYTAYQVFTGNVHEGGIITDVQWGSGVKSDELLTALQGDSTIGSLFTNCSSAADVAAAIKGFGNKTDKSNALAKVISAHLNGDGTDSSSGVISGLDDGYYFVKTKSGTTNTKYILTPVGTGFDNVNTKGDLASVEKKVWQEDTADFTNSKDNVTNNAWQDTADASLQEKVAFKLEAKLPTNLDEYSAFYFKLDDVLTEGLSVKADTYAPKYYLVHDDGSTKTATEITSGIGAKITDAQHVSFTCADAKKITGVKPGDSIVVVYEAELGAGYTTTPTTGNDNAVTLTYSNNPNEEYDGTDSNGDGTPDNPPTDKGETPEDRVRVLTYELDLSKVDGEDDAKNLKGAKFKLGNADGTKWAKLTATGETGKYDFAGWVSAEDATEVSTGDSTYNDIKICGLDEGTYKLWETQQPTGYNLPADKFTVVITSTLTAEINSFTESTNPLESLTITVDGTDGTGSITDGTVSAKIENNEGTKLPSTGGMGTTMFYVGGGILAVGSGALLLAKKRMKNKEN